MVQTLPVPVINILTSWGCTEMLQNILYNGNFILNVDKSQGNFLWVKKYLNKCNDDI